VAPRFDWNASMNTMLGYSGEPTSTYRSGLIVAYEAAMKLPVCQLDEIQLGRFWSQSPSEAMLDVLIPTTLEHLRNDLFSAYGYPTFLYLARATHYRTRPAHESALCALIEAWAPRLVPYLGAGHTLSTEVEVALAALETAERYPSALFAFENAYRAAGDHGGVVDILARRAKRATGPDRVALLVERARTFEASLDLEEAEYAWLDLLVEIPERACDEVTRLFALDPDPPWAYFANKLREAARTAPALRDELLHRSADLAATKLDDPELAREVLAELR
jgi:hypothetical protein